MFASRHITRLNAMQDPKGENIVHDDSCCTNNELTAFANLFKPKSEV